MAAALTRDELIAALQNEIRILSHLGTKITATDAEYRPTPKQRSTIELLRYLMVMGPALIKSIKAGAFDMEAWGAAAKEAETADVKKALEVIATQADTYAKEVGTMSDEDFRGQVALFGPGGQSRAAWIAHLILGGHAAYRTQIFLYLKSCGHDELNTMNLWQGIDAPMQTA